MSVDRRELLKFAGLTTLLGVGGISVAGLLLKKGLDASEISPDAESSTVKRWAMAIDISKFKTMEDYKRCIDVCHNIHNVPDFGDTKDEVKWIWTDTFEHVFPDQADEYISKGLTEKPFLLLCNHCKNPPCVRVCPTQATFKRESDGIVMMDFHRCIGCRFCMAACPYGSRSFNWRDPRPFIREMNPEFPTRTKGVVEKCNFCVERRAKGLIPACVEKSNGALIFGDLLDPNSEIRKTLNTHYSIRRKPELGTQPSVYYMIGGDDHA